MDSKAYKNIINKLSYENYEAKTDKLFSNETEINNINFIVDELNKICSSLDINEASERYIDCKKLVEYIFYEWGCKIISLDNIYINSLENINTKKVKGLYECKNLMIFEEKIKTEISERINSCSDDLPEYSSNNDSINFSELCKESIKYYQKCFSEDFIYLGTGIELIFNTKLTDEEDSAKEKISFLAKVMNLLEGFVEMIKSTPGFTQELIKRFIRFLDKNKRISRAKSKEALEKDLYKRIEDDLIPELKNQYQNRKSYFIKLFDSFMSYFLFQLGLINKAILKKDINELDSLSKNYTALLSQINLLKNESQE